MARVVDNFHEFEAQILEVEQEIPDQANQFKRAVALHALRGIVLKTPVDTGRARANWQVGLMQAPTGTLDVTPGGPGAANLAITQGSMEIGRSELKDDIWLTNNLSYIEPLEMGSSQQAPSGMVGVTLAEIDAQFGG